VSGPTHRVRRVLGESVLITLSILMAFSIDAAWDQRQEAERASDWLAALRADLEVAANELARQVERGEDALEGQQAFLSALGAPDTVPIDTLQRLAAGALGTTNFRPALFALRSATWASELEPSLGTALLAALADFEAQLDQYQQLRAAREQLVLAGGLSDIGSEIGSIYSLIGPGRLGPPPERFELAPDRLRSVLERPSVYHVFESLHLLDLNMQVSLAGMTESLRAAVRILDEMGAT